MAVVGSRQPTVAFLAVEHGIDDFYQGVVPALVPLLVLDRGYSLAQAGGIVLASTLLSSLAQPLFGALADRRDDVPWLRTLGLAVAATGMALTGLAPSYPWLLGAALLSGLGVAAYHPEAARAVHSTGSGDAGMGWFTFGGLTGYAAGPPVTTAVIGIWGLPATPVLALPAAVVVLLTLVRRRRRQPVDLVAARRADTAVSELPSEDWTRFGVLTLVIVTRSVAYYAVVTFMAVELVGRGGFGLAAAGGALTAFTAVGAVGTLTGGYLTRRFDRVSVIVVAYVAAIPCLAAVLLAPGVPVVLVAAGLLGLALNVPLPLHTTLGAHYLPRHRGTAAGITLGVAVSVGGLSTPFLGMVADVQGPRTVLLAATALPAVAAVLAILLRPRRPRRPAA